MFQLLIRVFEHTFAAADNYSPRKSYTVTGQKSAAGKTRMWLRGARPSPSGETKEMRDSRACQLHLDVIHLAWTGYLSRWKLKLDKSREWIIDQWQRRVEYGGIESLI